MKNKYRIIVSILILIIFLFPLSAYSSDTAYVWCNQSKKLDLSKPTSASLPSNSAVTDNPLKLESGSACLMEQSTGLVIYDHNMHEQLKPASVTKVMSILLIMEALDSGRISLTDTVACTEDAAAMGGSQIWLDVRETLTVDEMLKAICIVSANDCTVAMADHLEGSQEAFVSKMNEKAKALGMNDTCFKNCTGLDEDGHVTSSHDIAVMSRELLLHHPGITKYTTVYMDSLRDGKSSLVNTNKLIKNYNGCTGLKTGSTSLALYNLSASATRNNLSLIGVIMKAPTTKLRFAEAQKLLDYGFSNYEFKKFANQNDVVQNIKVNKGIQNNLDVVLENDAGVLVKKGNSSDIQKDINLDESITAPILKGQKLGEITYSSNGENLGTVNIISSRAIDKIGFGTMIKHIYGNWFSLFRI